MQQIHRTLICGIGLALGAAGNVGAAEHQHAGHDTHAAVKLQLDHGRKWPTDAALRQGMETLRGSFATRLGAIHAGKLSADEYRALGSSLDAEVAGIVAKCKLEPAADAMLHVVVADLLAAAAVMQGKAPGQPAGAAHRAVTALNDYGRHFEHPQWKPLK